MYFHKVLICCISSHSDTGFIGKKKVKRGITRHVVTRWYRGPEVILLQQKQATLSAVDMWSIGAIFAELLQMQRENRPDPTKRGPIFPGDSCFPLSIKDQMDYASRVDQMQVIFDVIGSPTEEEIAKITDEKARKYLRNLPQRKRKNLRRLFPGADQHAQDLLLQLLKFDVDKRITVDKALEHPYLKAVRDPAHERAKRPVTFSFESAQLGSKKLRGILEWYFFEWFFSMNFAVRTQWDFVAILNRTDIGRGIEI